jgi:SAM-dependent methyltransferase
LGPRIQRTARVVAGVERSRVDFEQVSSRGCHIDMPIHARHTLCACDARYREGTMQGDACALRADIGQFDAVLAANLLCRLPNPVAFLARCSDVVKPGGVLALVTHPS